MVYQIKQALFNFSNVFMFLVTFDSIEPNSFRFPVL